MILRSAASGQLVKVAQGFVLDLKIVYCIEVEGNGTPNKVPSFTTHK